MKCEICLAPALPKAGVCVFCRSPLNDAEAPLSLLNYLAQRLPSAQVRRFGVFRRGPARDFRVTAAGETFRARFRRGRLEFEPHLEAGEWVDQLVAALSKEAAGDAELRAAVSRSGWALR